MSSDTIAAVATPAGPAPVAIVRLSGPQALAIVGQLLAEPGADLGSRPPYSALEADLRLGPGKPTIPATLYLMRGPRSYTRDDVAEIHTLGSPPLVRAVLDALLDRGARLAEPGEFTRRAFLAGRIDLAQAEAVLAVIQATSDAELRAAQRALHGHASRHIHDLHDDLIGLRAQLEAAIDFAEHDIELVSAEHVADAIGDALAVVNHELHNADAGAVPPEGIRVALCGLPNAGKSSLFNALLASDRALVADAPGTTRDAVSEPLSLGGIRFRLYDTAGIGGEAACVTRHASRVTEEELTAATADEAGDESEGKFEDEIENENEIDSEPRITNYGLRLTDYGPDAPIDAEAAARARGLIAGTHIALVVVDGSRPLGEAARELWHEIRAPHKILVLTKSDLPPCISDADALALASGPSSPLPSGEGACPSAPRQTDERVRASGTVASSEGTEGALRIRTSAATGEGIGELKARLAVLVRGGRVDASPTDLVWNARHRDALRRAREALERAGTAAADDLGFEFVAADLRDAHTALGAITGQIVAEDLLDVIFAQFCIGK